MAAAPGGDLTHTPPAEQAVNTPVPIYAEATEEVPLSKVTLRYKPFGYICAWTVGGSHDSTSPQLRHQLRVQLEQLAIRLRGKVVHSVRPMHMVAALFPSASMYSSVTTVCYV